MRLSLGDLIGAGSHAIARYTGTLFAVFVVQALVAATCMLGVTVLLAQAFAHLPMFDEAVDGDLVALIWSVRFGRPSLLAVGGIVFATIVLWEIITWFLAGGLYGVFAKRPETRGETSRVFGASGAATFLAYGRLAVVSLPSWAVVLTVFGACTRAAYPRFEHALTTPDLIGPLALCFVPALLVLHVAWTITEYARADLTLRWDTHEPSALATYLRATVYVIKHPITLVHGAIGWFLFALVTTAYIVLAHGRLMYGAEGAVALFIARQGVSLLRLAFRIGVMAGQIELSRARLIPVRRAEPTPAQGAG